MEEDMKITCSVCGVTFNEGDVNIVDYELDLCTTCEADYLKKKEQTKNI